MVAGQAFKIGVFGSAGGDNMDRQKKSAYTIGKTIAESGNILCTGACYGLPYEAAVGADNFGGTVLGFSPAMNRKEHEEKYEFPTLPHILSFTGMGCKGRNLICTRTCDAGIFIAGRWGTMNEFTLMVDEGEGKVIGLLYHSGGFVNDVIIPGLGETDKQTKATIIIDDDPVALVERIVNELSKQ
ncbi:MAG: hypothetical protein ACKUBY_05415 [Candidatus Moraniibacteriota bacterium]|jgi:uncharacterized protein (TIGR00725 family)